MDKKLKYVQIALLALGLYSFSCMSASAQQTATVKDNVFWAQMVTDHAKYAAGEPIKIKITLINKSAVSYAVLMAAPWYITELHVLGASGEVQHGAVDYRTFRQPLAMPVAPHGSVVLFSPLPGRDWNALDRWGYGALPPGKYVIQTSLRISAFETDPSHRRQLNRFVTSPHMIVSNAVTITIK